MKIRIQLYILLFFTVFGNLSAQNNTIESAFADDVYTMTQAYQKLAGDYPFVRYVDDDSAHGLLAVEKINYKPKSGNRFLSLSVYRPNNDAVLPAVMMIHGGNWVSGTPEMLKMLALHLAEKGFVTVVPEYRLANEAIYPAAVDDLNAALQWMQENAREYKMDNTRFAVAGAGAGGQLATLLGVKNEQRLIHAAINIDGISTFMDLQTIAAARDAKEAGRTLPVYARWLGGARDDAYDNWQNASPLYKINKYSAPVCFIHGASEDFRVGRDALIKQLTSLDIHAEAHTLDAPHTFWLFDPWHRPTVNYMANFLEKIFYPARKLKNNTYDIVVAQDGSGDFETVQAAIDAVPDFREKETTIFIRRGIYQEKITIPDTKNRLKLVGEDVAKTIISFHNFANKRNRWGEPIGEWGSASVYICGSGFSAVNLTFENAAYAPEDVLAVAVCSEDAQFDNCRFVGAKRTIIYP